MFPSTRLFFAVVSFGVSMAAGAAHAANELCGQMITQNLTLTADQACTGDGLVVVGDGITIDLGGFTLSGDGDVGNDGVDVTGAGSGSVVIKNGTIRNFDIGIATHGMAPKLVKVSKVALRNNNDKGFDVTADQIVVDKSSASGNGVGLHTVGTNVKISATTVAGNFSTGVEVSANTLTVTKALVMGNGFRGLALNLGGSKVVIKSSQFVRNSEIGLLIAEATTTPGSILIAKNRVIGNGGTGVSLSGGDDPNRVVPVTVSGNLIAGNVGQGVQVGSDSDDSVVTGNRIIGNAAGGVAIASSAHRVLVKGNAISGNDIVGIGTESTDATLTKNVLNGNDVAILAPSGAIDGGGNKARGNLDDSCSASIACPPRLVPKPGPVIPTCGMVVTEPITLGADTPICSGDGLIVAADDVTINLNGHQVRGDGTPGKSGIKTSAPVFLRLAITNGIVRGFRTGITALAGGVTVVNVQVRDNVDQGAALGGDDVLVDKSEFVGNGGRGLTLAAANPPFAAKIKSSLFVGNEGGGLLTSQGSATVTNVLVAGNGGAGIDLASAGTGQLAKSVVAMNSGAGVRIAEAFGAVTPVTLKKNESFGNWGDGFVVASSAVGAAVDGNLAAGNAGRGVALMSNPRGTTLAKNDIVGNGGDGLFVDVGVGTTAILQNRAFGNGTYGLTVGIAAATLAKNNAVGNQLSGINTPFGAIDGGGNTARDNVNDPQCTAPIVCP